MTGLTGRDSTEMCVLSCIVDSLGQIICSTYCQAWNCRVYTSTCPTVLSPKQCIGSLHNTHGCHPTKSSQDGTFKHAASRKLKPYCLGICQCREIFRKPSIFCQERGECKDKDQEEAQLVKLQNNESVRCGPSHSPRNPSDSKFAVPKFNQGKYTDSRATRKAELIQSSGV